MWIAVASAEHVRIGRAAGFMQVCHGKGGPLRRTAPGDTVIYYSPSEAFRGKDRRQAFTAIGIITDRSPYQAEMFPGFVPWRRDVDWRPTAEVPIRPLLGQWRSPEAATGVINCGSGSSPSNQRIPRSSQPPCRTMAEGADGRLMGSRPGRRSLRMNPD
ncbi:hypothetical protein FHX09_003126 [Rhizobium sp. BK538]|nr:hypothetical protein [Rhizobium sp. BK538]